MTDDTATTPMQDDDALAAEMAMGLLDGAEARQAGSRMASDPAFAVAVRDWSERLAGLAMALTPVMPPARARQAIRERLGHARAPLSADPLARGRGWGRPVAGLAALLAIAATLAFLWLPSLTPWTGDQPDYRAELADEGRDMLLTASLNGRQLQAGPVQQAAPQGRDWELWWLGPDGAAPVSLGVVPRQGVMRVDLPDGLTMGDGVQLAVSEEPQGGSGTGQPTGAIVAVASLTTL